MQSSHLAPRYLPRVHAHDCSTNHSTIEICRLVRMGEEREFRIVADAMLAERMALRRCEQVS